MKTAKSNRIKPLINKIAQLADLKIPSGSILAVNFPGPYTMRLLNKTHLQHDYLTDVICFNYNEAGEPIEPGDIAVEIFISPDIAETRSKENPNLNYSSELALYLVHAILHATGMSDKTDPGKKQMRQMEARIISQLEKEFDFSEIFPV